MIPAGQDGKTATPADSGWPQAVRDALLALMRRQHGLDLAIYEAGFLASALARRCRALRIDTPAAYLERLARDPAEARTLHRSLRIVYSEFFRDPLTFALLEQSILPALVGEKEHRCPAEIRIWSAGCAAGQETWSVAILMEDLITRRGGRGRYRIFATDQSESHLDTARAAIYRPEDLASLRWRHLQAYFAPRGDAFAIDDRLRERVEFSCYDLLDQGTTCPPTSIYGDFDLVLCRNVLLYYRAEVRDGMLDKLERCLAPGGYLVTGETERRIAAQAGGLRPVVPSVAIFRNSVTA